MTPYSDSSFIFHYECLNLGTKHAQATLRQGVPLSATSCTHIKVSALLSAINRIHVHVYTVGVCQKALNAICSAQ
jgi:hypothetical protein